MNTTFHKTEDLINDKTDKARCPVDLAFIPNYTGINLVSVEGLSCTRQDDGQLVSLTIHFIPAEG